jgi:hypothetical protein
MQNFKFRPEARFENQIDIICVLKGNMHGLHKYPQKCKWVVLFLEIAISIFIANSTTRESIFKCKIALFEYHRIVD